MVERADRVVLSFSGEEANKWVKVNDGVMGGRSQSEVYFSDEQTAIFAGTVSLENYGGFASVRTHPSHEPLDGYDGFTLRVKGDGKRYQLRLHTEASLDGVAYQFSFDTQPDAWIAIRAPFVEFMPVYRGRRLTNVPALYPAEIQQIGFLIADKQQGPFRLEIDWIRAYKG